MGKHGQIKLFEPPDEEKLFDAVLETERWLDKYSHTREETVYWDVIPEKETDEHDLLLKDTSIYAGAAGIALFYLRLYVATGEDKYLSKAKKGIDYVILKYNGESDFKTDEKYLAGAYIGYMNSPAGGAYVASLLYDMTKEIKYKDFVVRVTDDIIKAANEENGALTWYGFYGVLGEGGLILYLLNIYDKYKNPKILKAAIKAVKYLEDRKEDAPHGGYRWYVMPTDTFPTIKKAGGYFPGFEYGTAGCGYIFACIYELTKEEKYLEIAEKAAEYILNIADYSSDNEAALVKYNDTYLTDLYYLGVCQGPVGTSRLFFKLYLITKKEKYKKFIEQLTMGIIYAGAPKVHSEGYWRTNCYCCGAAGMLEHFISVHKLTGKGKYLKACFEAAETIIGESVVNNNNRNWYTTWNRHEPYVSETYTGLYHGSTGCASSLLSLRQYITNKEALPAYLEDPYKILF